MQEVRISRSSSAPAPPVDTRPRLVLDNNVVLDWLLFKEPSVQPLGAAVEAGRVCWLSTPAFQAELAEVLRRGGLDRWRPDPAAIFLRWERWACTVEAAPPAPLAGLRCRDPDDQKFIDLAIGHRAVALISRDRAVLKLARAAARHGVAILTPERWAARQTAADERP